jgi:hypothetical protein
MITISESITGTNLIVIWTLVIVWYSGTAGEDLVRWRR